jgi:hypothetical protein
MGVSSEYVVVAYSVIASEATASTEAPLREGGSNPESRAWPWIASSLSLLAMTAVWDQ